MRILWISGSRVVGGAERVTLQIGSLLRARGHEFVAALTSSPLIAAAEELDIPCRPAALGGSLNLMALAATTRALRTVQPDAALVTGSDDWVWAGLAPKRRTALVLVRHMALALPPLVRRLAARRADRVIAVSEAARRRLLAGGILPPERIEVIPNPVRFPPRDALPTDDERRAARAALGIATGGRLVAFFGGTDPRKGLAAAACATRRADASLLVFGRGDASEVSRLTGDEHARVAFVGPTERVREALLAVDAVVLATASRLDEAAPLVLLEAMASGTPVASFAGDGVVEIAGETAWLAAPDDAEDLGRRLAALFADPVEGSRRAAAALERVRTIADPAAAAERYERVLESAARSASTRVGRSWSANS